MAGPNDVLAARDSEGIGTPASSRLGEVYACAAPRGRPDIANTALRIFLQEMGAAYDEERQLAPHKGGKHFQEIQECFGGRCCYRAVAFTHTPAVQDHLIPMNKADLDYKPTVDLREVAEELYDEVGDIAMTLIVAKIKRVRKKL